MKSALIFGATGQDGLYMVEFLLEKGYRVHAQFRPEKCKDNSRPPFSSSFLGQKNFCPIMGSVIDPTFAYATVKEFQPDEIYYLASNHELDFSLENYEKSRAVNLDGLAGALTALASNGKGRLFYASSSNIFYNALTSPQNELTPHAPGSLYGFFKSSAMSLIAMHREKFGAFACSGILYNHESPRRKEFFLPKKIVTTAVAIKQGRSAVLSVGDIGAVRDWGYAGDFVQAMWLMLQAERAQDYVIGTGITRSVEWVLDFVFKELRLDWRDYVIRDSSLSLRRNPCMLKADITKINKNLGWWPETHFEDVLRMMIESELTPRG